MATDHFGVINRRLAVIEKEHREAIAMNVVFRDHGRVLSDFILLLVAGGVPSKSDKRRIQEAMRMFGRRTPGASQ